MLNCYNYFDVFCYFGIHHVKAQILTYIFIYNVKSTYEEYHIYDRNGKLLVANQLSYDVMVQPNQVKPLDTIEFCNLLKKIIYCHRYIDITMKRYKYYLKAVICITVNTIEIDRAKLNYNVPLQLQVLAA